MFKKPNLSNNSVREITIFKGENVDTYSSRTLSDVDFEKSLKETMTSIKTFILGMKKILEKVSIWRNQCAHLFEKYSKGVYVIVQVLDALIKAKEGCQLRPLTPSFVKFTCSEFISCMLEGEAQLLFCGKSGYKKAAFALSSPPSSMPTFSRFGLVLRKLDWTMDLIGFLDQNHVHGTYSSFDDWEWCEISCRLKFLERDFRAYSSRSMEDESLQADQQREIGDREALLKSLNEPKPGMWYWRLNRDEFEAELEAIWRKTLQAPSQSSMGASPMPDPVLNCFWIDNLTFEIVGSLGGGSYRQVIKGKWLGETVAVAIVQNRISKEQLEVEADLLARVQHPNVVQLLGYSFKEEALDSNDLDNDDLNNSGTGYFLTEIMQQNLEDLINECILRKKRRSRAGSGTSFVQSPFDSQVALDMALQIAETMIQMKK